MGHCDPRLAVGLAGDVGMVVDQLEARARTQARVLELAREHFEFAASLEPGGALAPAIEASGLAPAVGSTDPDRPLRVRSTTRS